MNVEPNASIINTDGLAFPCFDDNVCTIPASAPRKSREIIYRSGFPGSKKMTIASPRKDKINLMSMNITYEKDRAHWISPKIVHESPRSFMEDHSNMVNDEDDCLHQPIENKQRIALSVDLTKACSNDRSRVPKKTRKQSSGATNMNEHELKKNIFNKQTEPIAVDWCRTASPLKNNRSAESSQISEGTSITSVTSRSGEFNETSSRNQNAPSTRCVSRSRTVGGTPSRRVRVEKPDVRKQFHREQTFGNDFEVDWPSTEGNPLNREPVALRKIRDTPLNSQRYATPKRAVSTSRSVRRSSTLGATGNYATKTTDALTPMRANRHSSIDHHQEWTPSEIKPRLYMTVSSPRKIVNLKTSINCLNNPTYSKKKPSKLDGQQRSPFDGNTASKVTALISEPLDFSEFDTVDFSSSEDAHEVFPMPFKTVDPLYCTASRINPFFQSIDKDAEEKTWHASFSSPIG